MGEHLGASGAKLLACSASDATIGMGYESGEAEPHERLKERHNATLKVV